MTHPEYQLDIAEEALQDIEEIGLYTLLTWGPCQMDEYNDLIDRSLSTIQANPNVGRIHSSVPYQCFPAGEHLIFYRVAAPTIYVVRILHSRMDLPKRLE